MRCVPAAIAPTTVALALLVAPAPAHAGAGAPGDPAPRTIEAWNAYVAAVERRIDAEFARAGGPFLVFETLRGSEVTQARAALARGEVFVRHLSPPAGTSDEAPDGMLHHWLGAVLVPGATIDQVLDFVRDYDHHARWYADVMASRTVSREGDRYRIFLKLQRSRFGVDARYNTDHDVVYRRHDASRASSRSTATRIAELEHAGTPREREKAPDADRDYLWRLNSYWRFQATPQGVLVECESVSLSRDIPWGLGFLVGPFVRSVPRDSLERTLTDMRAGVAATAGGRR